MKIETQITFKDYLKLQYFLVYSFRWMIFISVCGLVMFIGAIMELAGSMQKNDNLYFGLVFGAFIILMPYFIYRGAKKSFYTHKFLQEPISYEFLTDKLLVSSPYSNSELPWNKIYKVREFEHWFLIYQSNRTANLIPKATLTPDNIVEIKSILKSITGTKVILKK